MKDAESKPTQSEIKSRVATLLGAEPPFPPARLSSRESRKSSFGLAMILLGVFILAAGVYLPDADFIGRAIFMCAALVYAGIGAYVLDRARHRDGTGPR